MTEIPEGLQRRKRIVFPFYFDRSKKLVHIVARISDRPGTLAILLNSLGSKINLIGSTTYAIPGGEAIFSAFAEVLPEAGDAQAVRSLVSGSPGVVASGVWESKEGLLVDRFHTGIESGNGEQYIIFPIQVLGQTLHEMNQKFGPGGEKILLAGGRNFARSRTQQYMKILGRNPISKVEEATHIYETLGFGYAEVTVNRDRTIISATKVDCLECVGQKPDYRSCAFTRGLVLGSFEALLDKKFASEETTCRLKGDPVCQFRLFVAKD